MHSYSSACKCRHDKPAATQSEVKVKSARADEEYRRADSSHHPKSPRRTSQFSMRHIVMPDLRLPSQMQNIAATKLDYLVTEADVCEQFADSGMTGS